MRYHFSATGRFPMAFLWVVIVTIEIKPPSSLRILHLFHNQKNRSKEEACRI